MVAVDGSVDTAKFGTYTLTYTVKDGSGNEGSATCKVTVADTMAPVLALKGSAEVSHEGGATYTDSGATATDSFEGDLGADIKLNGNVDITKLGDYILTYNVSDSSGNAATAIRKVTVVDTTAPAITLSGEATLNHEAGTTHRSRCHRHALSGTATLLV